jgi:hypothetical protein
MRRASLVVIAACLLAAAPAGATLQASLDASGLTLTDTAGTPDDITISTNKVGLFVTVADKADSLTPACLLVSDKLHGFNCDNVPLVSIAAGAGNDRIDASRIATPLQADLGPGSDVLIGGSGNDTIASLADGVRDVVDCGAGQDTVQGLADPSDDIAADCESAQRSFAGSMLPKAVTVAAPSTFTLPIGRANVPLKFVATLTTAPPKHGKAKPKTLAHASLPATTGPVKLVFKLPKVSKGFLSRRPSIRVQANVTAIAADGKRYPLSLHSQSPGAHPQLTTLFDNEFGLKIPAKLRHPHH